MKAIVREITSAAIKKLIKAGVIPEETDVNIQIERCRHPDHGDFACNVALSLAKVLQRNPREIAETIKSAIDEHEVIAAIEIAGPGFINFRLADAAFQSVIAKVLAAKQKYGHSDIGDQQRIHLEYVSANPTGPLHVGHGRSAAYGACVANLLKAVGYQVHQEYYVNDAGRQMRILALSIWLRYLEKLGETIQIPDNAYQGQYVTEVAQELIKSHGEQFKKSFVEFQKSIVQPSANTPQEKIADAYLDQAIIAMQKLMGDSSFEIIRQHGVDAILKDIEDDLAEFGVKFDCWFRESQLFNDGLLQAGIQLLTDHGYTYEQEGALWFRATDLGDEKDRVLIRANGIPTYFASDVAYHFYKYQQGYDHIIDIFGADHHGYISRIRAFLEGLGQDPDKLKILLVQFAILYRGTQKVSMSTRKGQFVTLRELRYEVGNDAARFFYVMRKPQQHLDFDLELAKSQSNENPVYYIQYAHARICSVWRQLEKDVCDWDMKDGLAHVNLLTTTHEKQLLDSLWQYPELITVAAIQYEPHLIAHYLQNLANQFHTYYNANKFLVDDYALRGARLVLIAAVQQVLQNALHLLGITAVTEM